MNLLPETSSDLEKALDDVLATRLDLIDTGISDIWDPDKCPANMLPFLAWTMSVDDWDPNFSEEQQRIAIRNSILIHRTKGTLDAVNRTIAVYGGEVRIVEWWETSPQGTPFTFDVEIILGGTLEFDGDVITKISESINKVKPARCHFTITSGQQAISEVSIGAVVRPIELIIATAETL